jgi:DNA-binding response OmpR family regulator
MKLVLVEDNVDLAETMRILLSIRGHEVECYLNGQEFLRNAHSLGDGDVLITDYYLPDLNGIELLKRARTQRPALQAILLTGSREESITRAARRLPGCRLEFKPLDYESLERSIRALRGQKNGPALGG